MTANFPHDFPKLRNLRQTSVLFIGAGMSVGQVPLASHLYRDHSGDAEHQLGIDGAIAHEDLEETSETVLYRWAERVLAKLAEEDKDLPKLRLAVALGILDNPAWWGNAEIDFRGNTPRHRVTARFAKEGRWKSIWSFNWDCILEETLEQVGLSNGPQQFPTPWSTDHYVTHIDNEDIAIAIAVTALVVRKPHGCVRALKEARERQGDNPNKASTLSSRFMIGANELEDRTGKPEHQAIDAVFAHRLNADTAGRSNLLVGWRIEEKTLREPLLACAAIPQTNFSIAALKFECHHDEVCNAAKQTKDDAFFELRKDGRPNRDDLFLWLQTLFVMDQLCRAAAMDQITDADDTPWIDIASPQSQNTFLHDWCDEFLPTWSRLCWSAGLVTARHFAPHQVNLDIRDEHIPISYQHVERPDLDSGVSILQRIPALGEGCNAKDYPGGLFYEANQHLIIPLPCWGELNELRALKPLVQALRRKLGFVSMISIYPLGIGGGDPEPAHVELARERLAALMPILAFADPEAISIIDSLDG